MMPGMLMWDKKNAHFKDWLKHMKRLMGTRDVTFGKSDPGPALMQPFLLTAYYRLCHEKKLRLPELFQWDMIWEPTKEELQRAKEEQTQIRES
jgi:hypothetical protein